MITGLVRDWRYLNHEMGPYHVESPARLEVIYRMIEEEPDLANLVLIEPREAKEDEIALIHYPSYIDRLKETKGKPRVILDPDTSTCALSYETALLAVGGVLEAARAIMEKRIDNAFALVRPPGHHAEASRAMGFCLFNNVAIAARWLRQQYGLERILIIDWDLHHGNGTQHAFYREKEVLYFSTHQFPYYPGTGSWEEVGEGEGLGFTFNVPLSPGKGDADFLFIFKEILGPIVDIYQPQFILVSAGFDIYSGDPLGGMMVTGVGFAALAGLLLEMARKICDSRLLLVLEGGYSLEGLRSGVKEILFQLSGLKEPPEIEPVISALTKKELEPAFKNLRQYWLKT
ncbi:MAG: histone deacetylase [Candidatus Aminicenantes bacterium]|nr:histone deacetylase [Candidatus Aminicenantes bacterium]